MNLEWTYIHSKWAASYVFMTDLPISVTITITILIIEVNKTEKFQCITMLWKILMVKLKLKYPWPLWPLTFQFVKRGSTLSTKGCFCSLSFPTLIQETCRICNPLFYMNIPVSFYRDQLFKKELWQNTIYIY